MTGRLAGKVAIVTGAASGFGRATASLFAAEGACVVAADLDEDRGRQTVDHIIAAGGDAALVVGDVSESSAADAMVDAAKSHYGALHVLVNNAGIAQGGQPNRTWDAAEEVWDRVIKTNLRSVYICYAQRYQRCTRPVVVRSSTSHRSLHRSASVDRHMRHPRAEC